MGLFNPRSREEQAHSLYCENARFQENMRENKRKSEVRYEPPNCVATKKLIERPLSNLWSVLHIFWGVTAEKMGC